MTHRISRKEAAERIGVSHTTLKNWADQGFGPPFFQAGPNKRVLYDTEELEAWIEDNRTEPEQEDANPAS